MPHKNPQRVPMALQAMTDGVAYHEPINVLGKEGTMPAKTIEKTGIYKDVDGNFFFMVEGDTTGRDLTFSHERGGKPVTRAKEAAPENKAKQATPETKSRSTKKAEG